MKKDYLELKKALSVLLAGGVLTTVLSSCGPTELSASKSSIDMLDPSVSFDVGDNLNLGVTQIKEVYNEKFRLNINYVCEEGSDWRITDTKYLNMKIKTEGLPTGIDVYIDNVHTDTTIVSTKAIYNGILQDSMDDRIHNALMIGFPISDSVVYSGWNVIEGQNSEFIEGWSYGYNGHHNTSVESKRRLESDFLEEGVYANQIDSVIDLIIVDNNINETRAVSVSSKILIRVNNKITFVEKDKLVTYEYDMYGKSTKIKEEPNNSLTLKK